MGPPAPFPQLYRHHFASAQAQHLRVRSVRRAVKLPAPRRVASCMSLSHSPGGSAAVCAAAARLRPARQRRSRPRKLSPRACTSKATRRLCAPLEVIPWRSERVTSYIYSVSLSDYPGHAGLSRAAANQLGRAGIGPAVERQVLEQDSTSSMGARPAAPPSAAQAARRAASGVLQTRVQQSGAAVWPQAGQPRPLPPTPRHGLCL